MTSRRTLTGAALVLVLAAAVGGCGVEGEGPPGATDLTSPAPTESAPTDPLTDAPTDAPTDAEATAPEPTTAPESPKPVVGDVGVLISNSGWDAATGVTVRGYADTVDAAATCTLELSKSGVTRTATAEALESPTTMSCGELVVAPGDLSSGTWTAVLSYTSATAWGTSEPVAVSVP
jgi:hypothetical protein